VAAAVALPMADEFSAAAELNATVQQ